MFDKMIEDMKRDVTIICKVRDCESTVELDGSSNGVRAGVMSIIDAMAEHEGTSSTHILGNLLQISMQMESSAIPMDHIKDLADQAAKDIMATHGAEIINKIKQAMGDGTNE